MSLLAHPLVAWLLPIPLLAGLLWLSALFFRPTWRALDEAGLALRQSLAARGETDLRPAAAAVLGLFVLGSQEYFGGAGFFAGSVRPALAGLPPFRPGAPLDLATWGELLRHAWWGAARIGGYLAPLAVWPLLFRGDRLLDFGLRLRGLAEHAWIYALCVAVVFPAALLASRQPDFGAYYPFYRQAGRSWLDFAAWEAIYLGQFVALEIFFRGFWLRAARSLGASAIAVMVVPYTMIHYGKPWLEMNGAVVAGVVLGSLAARTGSVWAGVLVHSTIAVLMDCLVLARRGQLPVLLSPGGQERLEFGGWGALFWAAWGGALLVLLLRGRRRWLERMAPPGPGPA
jgi:membrane protease YdiL (CAAX protease family)